MKSRISIQIKGLILLLAFVLNTAVGFACAIGVDMGFNTTHHEGEEATEAHIHTDGKKHQHEKGTHNHADKNKQEKGNCCNDSVIKLSQADKSVPESVSVVKPSFSIAFIAAYNIVDILYPSQVTTSIKFFVRSYHPPIPDIRVSIQSFQI